MVKRRRSPLGIALVALALMAVGCQRCADEPPGAAAGSRSSDAATGGTPPGKVTAFAGTPEVKVPGTVVGVLQWRDRNGENLLALSEEEKTGTTRSATGEIAYSSRYLYATLFVRRGEKLEPLRTLQDESLDCVGLNVTWFEPHSLELTDLDGDGVSEATFVYRVDCLTGPGPVTTKVFLYEKGVPYLAWGQSRAETAAGVAGGEPRLDRSMREGPKEFREHALARWEKYVAYDGSRRP